MEANFRLHGHRPLPEPADQPVETSRSITPISNDLSKSVKRRLIVQRKTGDIGLY
jgi:hypothetical protein